MRYYTYEYWIDGVPEYVGKGKENRWCSHWQKPDVRVNMHWKNHLKSSIAKGKDIQIKVFVAQTERQAIDVEVERVALYGRRDRGTGTLYNLTDGGEGASGHRHSEESRRKIGIKSQNRSPESNQLIADKLRGQKQRPRTEEERKAVSARNREQQQWRKMVASNIGRVHSDEMRRKISDAKRGKTTWMCGKKHTDAAKALCRAAATGKKQSEVAKQKVRDAIGRTKWFNDGVRSYRLEASDSRIEGLLVGRIGPTAQTKAKMVMSSTGRKASAEAISNMKLAQTTRRARTKLPLPS